MDIICTSSNGFGQRGSKIKRGFQTLSVIRDGQIGWTPILERHLNDKSWEYIYINEENLALITHIAHMGVPSSPLIDSDERVYKMIQDMIKQGHGHIDPRRLHQ